MALSTAQLRDAYYPPCRDSGKNFLAAYRALDACLRASSYRVGSGSGAYNCRRITGGTGYSLHSYPDMNSFTFWNGYRIPTMALAVDINPSANPYGPRLVTNMPRSMIDAIYRIRTNSGAQVWAWGGYYTRSKDAMHFEIVCTPRDLATGIRNAGPVPVPEEEDMTTADEVRLIVADELKKAEDRQNAWIKSQFGTAVKSIKDHATTLREGVVALIRRLPGAPQD
jgi:hypothetical protein